jgi:hypothetical protein
MPHLGIRFSGKRIDKNRKEKIRTVLYVNFLILTKVEKLLFVKSRKFKLGSNVDHRVETAAFWRTFSDEGKIWPWLVRVGGARPLPLFTFTITSKVAVYAPAEWADTLTLFHL